MSWGSVGEFLNMGGYAFYVWASYGMCAVLIGSELWSARARRRHAIEEALRAALRGGA